jgi:SAM-dependent methyltransferase
MNDFWDVRHVTPVLPEFADLLCHYSHIPTHRLVEHVQKIRREAWAVRQYPCFGSYTFQELSLAQHPMYATVCDRLKSRTNATLLDLGCGIGQDLRKLVRDGVPGHQLIGYDLEPAFFSVGYEVFKDRLHLKSTFIAGDFLAAADDEMHVQRRVTYDFIHAADFFHLWSWAKQIRVSTRRIMR